MTAKLTQMFDEASERGMRETPAGMAHWVGSGPKGRTCRECQHYNIAKTPKRYTANSQKHGIGELMPVGCKLWRARMPKSAKSWPKIHHKTAACKHFAFNEAAPKAFETRPGNG